MPERELDRKLRHLPTGPGVYLFRDRAGDVLYIGKAKSLRARVRSHFVQGPTSPKNEEMLRRVADVDTIVLGSEAEALLLEANLIKSHRPRFNIRLRDDKRYPYIKVTVQEPFPRVFVTRRVENDGGRYFGPFTEVGAMRQALEVIKRLHTVRSCRYHLPEEAPARPCLDYHIGRCLAPCVGLQDRADYGVMVEEILEILGGRVDRVRLRVRRELRESAAGLEFERAANLRDVLVGLDAIERRQRALDLRGGDQDVLGLARDGDRACAVLLRIRGGKLLGRDVDFFENLAGEEEASLVSAAVTRGYLGRGDAGLADLPREVLLPSDFEDRALLTAVLERHAGRRIRLHVPQRGEKLRLVELAAQNARHLLEERAVLAEAVDARAEDVLYQLQDALDLKVVPRRIVGFDVSHTQGSEVVGSAVSFDNGVPEKDGYRRFRVRGEWGNDDFRSMGEVVGRYLRRQLEEERAPPDLVLVDGGRGQLSAALRRARELGVDDLAFCALAKREEEVFLPGRAAPQRLPRSSPALHLLQRVRNEAHRFAHGYNRRLRRKRTLTSELLEVPGIGPARRSALLERFGSVRAVRAASEAEIAGVPGFSRTLARRLKESFG